MKLKRLYDIIVDFKEYGALALYLVIGVLLLAHNDSKQIRAIRSATVGGIAFLQDAFGFIPDYFDLREQNRVLQELNLSLADEVSRLREARLENIRLRQMLKFKESSTFTYVPARVVGKQLYLLRNTITIDAGERAGVQENMPVVTDAGLVGKVVATSADYAIAQILLNRVLRVSARVQRSRVDGILVWQGGSSLSLNNVAKTLDVQRGDVVMTSEYSSLFPPGIRIGVVSGISVTPGSLFQNVEVTPGVDFPRLEEVFVALYEPDSSRVALEQTLERR
ncbi:MAG: rod shape-determining protein MreC [Ignavibacteria bacterium]|nr:rod shape-determining protein MreC [Ignavibacteria bacterium]